MYEKEADKVKISEETLRKDGWGSPGTKYTSPRFYSFLAVETLGNDQKNIVGMALFFLNYSTWEGTTCYLEDLVVSENYRGRGLGEALIHAVGHVCLITGMPRLSWQCLDWNKKSLDFYASLGASTMPEWENLRMTTNSMQKAFGEQYSRTATKSAAVVKKAGSSWSDCFMVAEKVCSLHI